MLAYIPHLPKARSSLRFPTSRKRREVAP
jgi:hypothetical protein